MTPADLFRRAGRALYGEEFVSPLSRALGVEKSTVRKWADGKSRIPLGVWREILASVVQRSQEFEALVVDLAEHLNPILSADPPPQK